MLDVPKILGCLRRRYGALRAYNPAGLVSRYGLPYTWHRERGFHIGDIEEEDFCDRDTFLDEMLKAEHWLQTSVHNALERGITEEYWVASAWEDDLDIKRIPPLDKGIHLDGAVIGVDYDDK